MSLEGDLPEETEQRVRAVKRSLKEHPTYWRIGKRGTIFTEQPDAATVDLYKDVTHLYKHKQGGKRCGRIEWRTTLWIAGAESQIHRTTAEVYY
jgi:hypothetical protein